VAGIDRVATADWLLQPEDDWHGFGDVAEDYVLLDPIKVTLVMPGLTAGGALSDCGIPAAVVSKFLWERGLVVEKTGLYSFLVLFSMGITKGKWSTLLTRIAGIQTQLRRQCQPCQLPAFGICPGPSALSRPGAARPVRPIT
jgi:arginine decarboxylase